MNNIKLLLLAVFSLFLLVSCGDMGNSSVKEATAKQEEPMVNQVADQTPHLNNAPSASMPEATLTSYSKEEAISLQRRKGGPQIADDATVAALYQALDNEADIQLENLIYYLERPLRISGKNDFTLDGNGSTFIMENKSENVVVLDNCNNVTLKNFKATHVEPEGPIGCTGSVIQVNGNYGVSIEGCELNGSGIIGVVAYDSKNLRVVDNYIYNNSQYGVLYQGATTIEISGNTFENNGKDGEQHIGLALDPGLSQINTITGAKNQQGLQMSNNIFKKNKLQKEQAIADKGELEALYRAVRTGTDITLKDLVYHLDSPLRISRKTGFTLDGAGATLLMTDKNEDVVIVEYSNNITLMNFKATHVEPEGPIGCTGSVIQVNGNDGVYIERCELNGSGIIGVMAYQTTNLRVVENYIYNNSKYGVLYDKYTKLEVRDNKFEDNGGNGDDHVAQALNDYLSEVQKMEKGSKNGSLQMSGNIFQ